MALNLGEPIGTEALDNEDWCPSCKSDVAEWNVFMEEDSEGGYEKIHRCPNCGAKALRHQWMGAAGFIAFVLTGAFTIIGIKFVPNARDEPGAVFVVAFILSALAVCGLWALDRKLQYLGRHRTKQPDNPFAGRDRLHKE